MNADVGADSQPLLSGDADEETQMKPRLIEKKQNAVEGKA